ncbi:hypothetical protein [Catenovulum agarivorans]|uniref:hypothetical protein n=1 Tax=Catenovulum agarivorans TaxID=1172192 RepID=UPI000314948E|nr:hypothetical protein [Catenovulum agarivorans]
MDWTRPVLFFSLIFLSLVLLGHIANKQVALNSYLLKRFKILLSSILLLGCSSCVTSSLSVQGGCFPVREVNVYSITDILSSSLYPIVFIDKNKSEEARLLKNYGYEGLVFPKSYSPSKDNDNIEESYPLNLNETLQFTGRLVVKHNGYMSKLVGGRAELHFYEVKLRDKLYLLEMSSVNRWRMQAELKNACS